ncbi:MAG: hypothetical protein AAF658_01655 [Myxococcota bacterium]
MQRLVWAALLGGLASSCGASPLDVNDSTDAESLFVPPPTIGENDCRREAPVDDRPRSVVVSKPYRSDGTAANLYETLTLTRDGSLLRDDQFFVMGRSNFEQIVFTPDGRLGFSPQDDGTLGVFRVNDTGAVEVLHTAYDAGGYVSRLVMHPEGRFIYGLKTQGSFDDTFTGAIYKVAIGCDDTLENTGALLRGISITQMTFIPGRADRFLVTAKRVTSSKEGHHVHLFETDGDSAALRAGVRVWRDDDALPSAISISNDGSFAVLTDDSFTAPAGGRVAFIRVDVENSRLDSYGPPLSGEPGDVTVAPTEVVFAPDDSAALMVQSYPVDAFRLISYDPRDAQSPARIGSELDYAFRSPQLPDVAVGIERGALWGTVVASELISVRVMRFDALGGVEDVDRFALGGGDDIDEIIGSLGVQP